MKRIMQDDFKAQPATDDSGIVIFKFFYIITKIDGWRDLPRATRAILELRSTIFAPGFSRNRSTYYVVLRSYVLHLLRSK